jgi:hypothetical protein
MLDRYHRLACWMWGLWRAGTFLPATASRSARVRGGHPVRRDPDGKSAAGFFLRVGKRKIEMNANPEWIAQRDVLAARENVVTV